MRTQQYERADRVGAAPGECLAVLGIQRFGYEEKAIEPVRKTQTRSDTKRNPRIPIADNPADHRTESESNSKRSADQAERASAFFLRCDIRDVGECRRDGRTGYAGNDSANKQPAECWG